MSNDTRTIDLVINNLTEEQLENVFSPDPNELWMTPDDTPEKLAQKVDKTSDPNKIYGTDAQGNQTTYDKSGFQDKLIAGTDLAFSYVSEDLPEGYTKLEYIESTGTQYIDTGVIYTDVLNARLELDAVMLDSSTTVRGIGRSGSYFGGPFVGLQNDGLFGYSAGIGDQITGVSGSSNIRYKYDLNIPASTYVVKDENNNVLVNVTNITKSTRSETPSCILFGYYGNPTTGGGPYKLRSMKIYSAQFYDNGTLVRDFVPCLDDSNIPGLYDLVNQQMYYNAGTGAFLSGPSVASLKLDFTNESGYALRSEIPTTFVFDQAESATTWHIAHNLGKYPSVVIVDSTGAVIGGKVTYVDINNIDIEFNAQFTGKAYLN